MKMKAFRISADGDAELRELRVLGGKKKSLNRRPGGHGNRLRTMPTLQTLGPYFKIYSTTEITESTKMPFPRCGTSMFVWKKR